MPYVFKRTITTDMTWLPRYAPDASELGEYKKYKYPKHQKTNNYAPLYRAIAKLKPGESLDVYPTWEQESDRGYSQGTLSSDMRGRCRMYIDQCRRQGIPMRLAVETNHDEWINGDFVRIWRLE